MLRAGHRLGTQALEVGAGINSARSSAGCLLLAPPGASVVSAQVGECGQTLAGSRCPREGAQAAAWGLGGTS